jgi:toxin YoeB
MVNEPSGWTVVFTHKAQKQLEVFEEPSNKAYAGKLRSFIEILKRNPYENPPPFEKLSGDLDNSYSRRISKKHRLVYTVDKDARRVTVQSCWGHYGDN